MRRTVSGIMLTLLLIGMLTLAFDIQSVKASGIIYIRADGSIEPSTVPIQRDGDLYTLTGNITDYDGIVVERDNIILDGANHLFDGGERTFHNGVTLEGRENVTIKNMIIKHFAWWCIYLNSSSGNFILANEIASLSRYGGDLLLESSSNNLISGNNITDSYQYYDGICLSSSSNNNSIIGNNIQRHDQSGVGLHSSSNNIISGNNITNNGRYGGGGISILGSSSQNRIYHNNVVDNAQQCSSMNSTNIWDDGYPSGGNYWSDYTGTDGNGDGIGDTPYVIDVDNQDRYPLMHPWSPPHARLEASVDIHPDTLNLRSRGKWVTAYIELPEGYDADNIDVSTVLLNGTVPAELRPVGIGDEDGDGVPDLMVKFNRSEVQDFILGVSGMITEPPWITLTVTGSLSDGTEFEGSDTIRVICRGGGGVGKAAFLR